MWVTGVQTCALPIYQKFKCLQLAFNAIRKGGNMSCIVNAANKMLVEIPDEKKERLLQLKKAGYRLFLLSNTIDVHWDYCVEHLFPYQNYGIEDYFEQCFLSQRMHLAKPNARIYEEVIRQANIHPDETLFIDDLKENCEAAEKLGIHTFQNVKFDDWLALTFVR